MSVSLLTKKYKWSQQIVLKDLMILRVVKLVLLYIIGVNVFNPSGRKFVNMYYS